MPQIPIPSQVPIERASWNPDFQAGGLLSPANNDRTPANPIDIAQQQQSQLAQNNQRTAAAAGDINDMQAKQRSMQLSMLSGVLNEPDPVKQQQLLQNIVPIANKINPSYQIDSNIDIPTVRALVQSQVSPTEQATLENNLQRAQMVNSLKAQTVTTYPATGQKIIIDKYTSAQRPITTQENEYYNATGQLPGEQGTAQIPANATGIFPNLGVARQNFDNFRTQAQGGAVPIPPGGGQPLTGNELGGESAQTAFGFPQSSYVTNPNALKLEQKNAAAFEQNRGQRDILADQAEQKLNELEPDLVGTKDASGNVTGGVQGGPGIWKKLGFAAEGLSPSGSTELNTATQADAETKDLANTLSQMQVQPGSRGTKIALQTLLASKPDPYNQTPEANQKLLTNARTAINQYKLETDFLDAYKDANPQHIIDNKAYDLFDALQKQFPLSTIDKTGKPTFNGDNVAALRDAIPDALSNPSKYLNAKTEAQSRLRQPNQTSAPTQPQQPTAAQGQQTRIDTPEAIGAAYQSGKITEAQARALLANHGIK